MTICDKTTTSSCVPRGIPYFLFALFDSRKIVTNHIMIHVNGETPTDSIPSMIL